MTLLADQSSGRVTEMTQRYPFISGQLQTPLSRYRVWDGAFAADSGGFSGADVDGFRRMITRLTPYRGRCLFVTVPDVVGSARRTLETWRRWQPELQPWPLAFVAQDGIEDLDIPWYQMSAVFIGGTDAFKDSQDAVAVIRCAQWHSCHVHIGRVNTPARWRHFEALGADTCDGTGLSKYDWMVDQIAGMKRGDAGPLIGMSEVTHADVAV